MTATPRNYVTVDIRLLCRNCVNRVVRDGAHRQLPQAEATAAGGGRPRVG